MKNWNKKIGGMSLAIAILFSGSGAVHAAEVHYGMTGAMAVAAMQMQAASETPQATARAAADDKPAVKIAATPTPTETPQTIATTAADHKQVVTTTAAPALTEKPSAPMIAGKPYTRTIDIVASAYGPREAASEYAGLTYMGTKERPGVIAVDPKVIPLGTKVFVTGYNTPLLPAGGFVATAEDTGGAIKGNRIDIFLNGTQEQVLNFGLQNVKVYVLK